MPLSVSVPAGLAYFMPLIAGTTPPRPPPSLAPILIQVLGVRVRGRLCVPLKNHITMYPLDEPKALGPIRYGLPFSRRSKQDIHLGAYRTSWVVYR